MSPVGKEIAERGVPGLKGAVDFAVGPEARRLGAGQLLDLAGGVPHALRGVADASVLVTIPRG